MEHPILYKRGAAADVMLQWRIWTDGATVYTEHGQVGGKLQTSTGNTKKGKNPGKANATTPEEQADKEAAASWTKRIDRSGYRMTMAKARDYLHSVPMLAHKYEDHLGKSKNPIQFPVLVQPKLDGVRALSYLDCEGDACLQSRKLTYYTAVQHILAELTTRLSQDEVLDGELYCHGLTLGEVNSYTKKDRGANTLRIQYHVYDATFLSEQGQDQHTRREILNEHFDAYPPTDLIVRVPTYNAVNDAEVQALYKRFVAEGYEGAIVRTEDHTYEFDTRSHGLLKLKDHIEEEFEIIAVTHGEGKGMFWPVFTCANPKSTAMKNGKPHKEFSVLPKGTDADKRKMLFDAPKLIGQQLTVRFHQWTQYNQPEHPRGITIRTDI